HVFEGGSNGFWRTNVLELHGGDLHTGLILVENHLKQRHGILLNHRFPGGQGFVDLALADHFPHGGFSCFADGLVDISDVEQEVASFFDLILNDEFDRKDVHIAGQHQGFLGYHLLAALLVGAEADFHAIEFGDLRLEDGFNERNLEVRAWFHRTDRNAEPFHDTFFIRCDDKHRLPDQKDQQGSNDEIHDAA